MTRTKYTYQPVALVVLILSLVAFFVRAGEFLLVDSKFPSVFIAGATMIISLAYLLGGDSWFRRAVKVWGGFLALYGMTRLLLGAIIQFGLIESAHAIDAASLVYMLLSALYVGAGIYLLRTPTVSI